MELKKEIWIQDADLEVIKIKMIEEMVIDIIVDWEEERARDVRYSKSDTSRGGKAGYY